MLNTGQPVSVMLNTGDFDLSLLLQYFNAFENNQTPLRGLFELILLIFILGLGEETCGFGTVKPVSVYLHPESLLEK